MWPKTFITILTALCLIVAVGFAGTVYAGDSPYQVDPVGDEHPWGGEECSDDGTGAPIFGGSDPQACGSIPQIDGAPFYLARTVILHSWSKLSRCFGNYFSASITEKRAGRSSRSTAKTSGSVKPYKGARNR
jgi:hypothetical protein